MKLGMLIKSYDAPSRLQQAWAISGLAVLVVVAVIAAANFQAIYNVQKDFVTGSLLSLVGFCFGKALSRSQEEKVIELIRTAPTPHVVSALREETEASLHAQGVFEQLALLQRNVMSAAERLSEYFDLQCRMHDFYKSAPLLRVTLDDLDKTTVNIVGLWKILRPSVDAAGYTMSSTARLALISVRRDLREALGRRNQAYEWFASRLDSGSSESAWEVFAVMSSDIFKADRTLDDLLSQYVPFPLDQYARMVSDYVEAATRRAAEFRDAIHSSGITEPAVFDVMISDLTKAAARMSEVKLGATAPTAAAGPMG